MGWRNFDKNTLKSLGKKGFHIYVKKVVLIKRTFTRKRRI